MHFGSLFRGDSRVLYIVLRGSRGLAALKFNVSKHSSCSQLYFRHRFMQVRARDYCITEIH